MLVLHDDISTGKRCVAVENVADGAYASTSHGFMVLCTLQTHRSTYKYQQLVANERGQSFIDGCNNDRWPNDIDYCDIR